MSNNKINITSDDLLAPPKSERPVVDFGHTAIAKDIEVNIVDPNIPANPVMAEPTIRIDYPSEQVATALGIDSDVLLGTTVHKVDRFEPHSNGPATIKVELP